MNQVSDRPGLLKSLGLGDVVLFIVVAGTNFQWVATAAATGPFSLVMWIVGGFTMFLPLSVCVAYLSSRYPDQGGLYVWSKRAFGPFAGFMTGWTYWSSNLPYLPGVLYFAAGSLLFRSGGNVSVTIVSPNYFILFALAGLAVGVILNVRGLAVAKWLCNAGAVARWLVLGLLTILGIAVWWRFGSATVIDGRTLTRHLHLADVIFWSTIALAWTGPEAASFMGGEIRDARRTIPLALAIAAPIIAAIFMIGTLSVLLAVPPEHTSALYGVMQAIDSAAVRLGLSWLVPIGSICVTLSCIASVVAWLGAMARIPFVAGIDCYLPKSFARLHPRYGSPTLAIVTQALIAGVFAVLGQLGTSVRGAYNVMVDLTVLTVLLPFVPLFAAAIKLSAAPPVAGEIRIWGGRVTIIVLALLGLATTLGAMALSLVPAADETNPMLAALKVVGMTAALLLSGAGVYLAGVARARRYGGSSESVAD
jgi:glutamate:GABA antiporter